MAGSTPSRQSAPGCERARAPGGAASGFAASRGYRTGRSPSCTRRRPPARPLLCSWRSCHSAHSPRRVLCPGTHRPRRDREVETEFATTRWQQIRPVPFAIVEPPAGRSPMQTSSPTDRPACRSTEEPAMDARRCERTKTSADFGRGCRALGEQGPLRVNRVEPAQEPREACYGLLVPSDLLDQFAEGWVKLADLHLQPAREPGRHLPEELLCLDSSDGHLGR